jgi:hypothetical protein
LQVTLVLGRYGPDGIKLSEARELPVEAEKTLAAGRSPARLMATEAARRRDENSFGEWAEEWLDRYQRPGDESQECQKLRYALFDRQKRGISFR